MDEIKRLFQSLVLEAITQARIPTAPQSTEIKVIEKDGGLVIAVKLIFRDRIVPIPIRITPQERQSLLPNMPDEVRKNYRQMIITRLSQD